MGIEERKERERTERRASVFQAALEVYAEEGYHGTTMEKIAERAELSRATLYLYFKTKDNIFVQGIVSRSDSFGDQLRRIYDRREEVGPHLVEELWGAFKRFYIGDPVAFNMTLYFHQGEMIRSLPESLRLMLDRSGSRNYALLCRIMDYGVREGLLVSCNPRTLAEVVWTSFLGIIHLENSKRAMSRRTHLEPTWDLAFRVLSTGMVSRPVG